MEKRFPELGELGKFNHVFDPPPPFLQIIEQEKWKDVVQIQLEYETVLLKHEIEILTQKLQMYDKLKKIL